MEVVEVATTCHEPIHPSHFSSHKPEVYASGWWQSPGREVWPWWLMTLDLDWCTRSLHAEEGVGDGNRPCFVQASSKHIGKGHRVLVAEHRYLSRCQNEECHAAIQWLAFITGRRRSISGRTRNSGRGSRNIAVLADADLADRRRVSILCYSMPRADLSGSNLAFEYHQV